LSLCSSNFCFTRISVLPGPLSFVQVFASENDSTKIKCHDRFTIFVFDRLFFLFWQMLPIQLYHAKSASTPWTIHGYEPFLRVNDVASRLPRLELIRMAAAVVKVFNPIASAHVQRIIKFKNIPIVVPVRLIALHSKRRRAWDICVSLRGSCWRSSGQSDSRIPKLERLQYHLSRAAHSASLSTEPAAALAGLQVRSYIA